MKTNPVDSFIKEEPLSEEQKKVHAELREKRIAKSAEEKMRMRVTDVDWNSLPSAPRMIKVNGRLVAKCAQKHCEKHVKHGNDYCIQHSKKPCRTIGCKNLDHAKGLCQKHYTSLLRSLQKITSQIEQTGLTEELRYAAALVTARLNTKDQIPEPNRLVMLWV